VAQKIEPELLRVRHHFPSANSWDGFPLRRLYQAERQSVLRLALAFFHDVTNSHGNGLTMMTGLTALFLSWFFFFGRLCGARFVTWRHLHFLIVGF
jgi:hypothetical protein